MTTSRPSRTLTSPTWPRTSHGGGRSLTPCPGSSGSTEHGKYSREDAIHSLLMPMRTDSNEIGTDASNLWIIDERLAFHDYLASDKTLKSMPITGSDQRRSQTSSQRDSSALRFPGVGRRGETLPLPSIVVVEIKRPMRNDASEGKDPIQQILDYVKRVRTGGVMTAPGARSRRRRISRRSATCWPTSRRR